MSAVDYTEYIIKKAELLKSRLKYCFSSDVMLQAYIDLEDIIHASNALKQTLKKA